MGGMTPREIIAAAIPSTDIEERGAASYEEEADEILAALKRHGYVVESVEAFKRATAIIDLVARHLRDLQDANERALKPRDVDAAGG